MPRLTRSDLEDAGQNALFDAGTPVLEFSRPAYRPPTIEEQFRKYHAEHPAVYALLVRAARQVLRTGRAHYGIATLFEWARWHMEIERDEHDDFKLNNNYRSRYARLMMEQEPDLADFFEIRELKAD